MTFKPFPWKNREETQTTPINRQNLNLAEGQLYEQALVAAEGLIQARTRIELEAILGEVGVRGTGGVTNTASFGSESIGEAALKNKAVSEAKLAVAITNKFAELVLGGSGGKTTTTSFGNETVAEAAIKAKAVSEAKLSVGVIEKLERSGTGITEAEVKTLIKSLAVIGASEKTTTTSFGSETVTTAAIKAKAVDEPQLSAAVIEKLEKVAGLSKIEVEALLAKFPQAERTGETYTLIAADAGLVLDFTNATKAVVTLPANIFTAGQTGQLCQIGAGTLEVVAGSGTTVLPEGPYIAKERGATIGWRARTATQYVLGGSF